ILARPTPCDKGEVCFASFNRAQGAGNGAQENGRGYPRISYAFQDGRLLPNLTALQNLTFAGGNKEDGKALLSRAALSGKENKRPSRLSGGEKQRVSLLRAFAAPFDILLADEPFSALDIALKERMIRLFNDLLQENARKGGEKTAVVVTHSVKEALKIGDRAAVLKDGAIVAEIRVNRTDEAELERGREQLFAALTRE
ncbi:MAG: ATP-binding cassette domain-containing protein, partial [Candidatus Scatosoma sp.]